MFFTKRHSEVLVAGAGPVGMFAALLCAERGLEARIVDQEWRTSARSYALALHPRSLEILNGSGLTEELLRVGHKVDTIAFYEGSKRLGEIKLSALALPNPFLLVLPQSALEGLLEERLEQKKVELMWNHRLHGLAPSDIEVAVTLQRMEKASSGYGVATSEWVIDKEYVHKSSFVIGADGHRSIVRRDINAEYTYSGDPIGFAVFEFEAKWSPDNEVRVVLHEGTTNVLWPLGGGRFRWSFQIDPKEAFEETRDKSRMMVYVGDRVFPQVEEEGLTEYLRERAPWFDAAVGEIAWSLAVRFERGLTTKAGEKRAWLVGDAVHLGGPVGVHSMNLGFREVTELLDRIVGVRRHRAELSTLAAYPEAFQRDWQTLFGPSPKLRVLANAPEWVKRDPTNVLRCTPATGDDLAPLLAQLGLALEA
jgi:2-polyprenyl-6-methoxyphenol hydroxylase-like FAD-dependent oxidoreductase